MIYYATKVQYVEHGCDSLNLVFIIIIMTFKLF